MVIHKAARVQESWKVKAPGNIRITAIAKGYIIKSKFHKFGLHIIKYLKSKEMAYRLNLLFINGHKIYVYNLPFYEVMSDKNIEILTIPAHTSHVL